MILYYAVGSGAGHVVRAGRMLRALGEDDALVIASSAVADARALPPAATLLPVPDDARRDRRRCQAFLAATLDRARPDAIYVDAFPGGLLSEWCDADVAPGVPRHHVARRLAWSRYAALLAGALPRFARSLVLEPLADDHHAALRACSDAILPFALPPDPPFDAPTRAAAADALAGARRADAFGANAPLWLVVHTGPRDEVDQLLAYARELPGAPALLVLVHPDARLPLPPGVARLAFHPAAALFPAADRIVTACGFNLMRETLPWRERHAFLPLPRRFDDQFARAALRRAEAR